MALKSHQAQDLDLRSVWLLDPSQMTAGVAVPPERPPRGTHPDSGDRGSGDGNGKKGVGGGSSTDRDNDLWGGNGRRDDDDGGYHHK